MKEITEDYVSFEVAKLLKEKGFKILTSKVYDNQNELDDQCAVCWVEERLPYISAPTLQMAVKWLREEYKLHIAILWDCGAYVGKNSFRYHIDRMDNYEDKGYNKIGFDSNEEAVEAAIKYCLENLI